MVIAKTKEAKDQLKDILCWKAVFLKMDGATRQHTSFVAINAQFVMDNAIIHSAAAMKAMVEVVMEDFGLQRKQVL